MHYTFSLLLDYSDILIEIYEMRMAGSTSNLKELYTTTDILPVNCLIAGFDALIVTS